MSRAGFLRHIYQHDFAVLQGAHRQQLLITDSEAIAGRGYHAVNINPARCRYQVNFAPGDNVVPAGIATQKADLRQRLNVDKSATQLKNLFAASVELMQLMARACGHDAIESFNSDDLATWHRDMALLSGVKYSGFIEP